jgi:hypothetical protein
MPMTHLRRFLITGTLTLLLLDSTGPCSHAQPVDEAADAMDARLAAATVTRVGPSYLYPAHGSTPGLVNPDITQTNIDQTICNPQWSTKSIRPPVSYTNTLKTMQLAASQATDKTPAHYEEDHLVSLELGGHPRDPRNLWPERWGTPGHPRTVPGAPGRSQGQGHDRERAPRRGLPRHVDAARGAVHHRHRLVQVLPGQGAQVRTTRSE